MRIKYDPNGSTSRVGEGASWISHSGGATVPTAPSGLTATASSSSQINLQWVDNSSNETGFMIERKTGLGGTYAQIATVGAGIRSYASTGLIAATTYYYRVRASSLTGNSDYSNESNATTLSNIAVLFVKTTRSTLRNRRGALYY